MKNNNTTSKGLTPALSKGEGDLYYQNYLSLLQDIYKSPSPLERAGVRLLSAAGSNRRYYRFTTPQGGSLIGVIGTSAEENRAFVTIARHLREKGVRVPEVYAVSDDEMCYLQQDLGDRSLFDALKSGRESHGNYSDYEKGLLRKVISELPKIQFLGAEGMDWSVCYPQPQFDEENVMFDLNYFKYCFLKPSGVEFNEVRLQRDFKRLAEELTKEVQSAECRVQSATAQPNSALCTLHSALNWAFMYRDFQARNIMLDEDDNPWFIDFQGGRRGPAFYDVVSFLWQASAHYPEDLRQELVAHYESLIGRVIPDNQKAVLILFRLLQVLGAYGYRGYFERKKHFLDSIKPALENLRVLLSTFSSQLSAYPYLVETLRLVQSAECRVQSLAEVQSAECRVQSATAQPNSALCTLHSALCVTITSFSFKRGIPEDPSGNGGGYVFDCRSTHNPGRYEPYKNLTGLDEPVKKFLEDDGEITAFLESVYKLADFHVARYIERGFTSLMFSFGCTGGQHRSVYSAQHLADHLRERFPQIKINLHHREQERPQALIFAAGLGTRLKPLTDTMPKALVPVGGKTLLERTINTLKDADIDRIVVNVHHFSDQIKSFLQTNDFHARISVSDETDKLLDTGGGLLKARHLFNGIAPILIHNVDIISNAELKGLCRVQSAECRVQSATAQPNSALCTLHSALPISTLLVSSRKTSRYLHFDDDGNLIGWQNVKTGEVKGRLGTPYAFSGIHIVSQQIFPLLEQYSKEIGSDKFSITDFYLWACQRCTIKAFVQPDLDLTDVGKLDTLKHFRT